VGTGGDGQDGKAIQQPGSEGGNLELGLCGTSSCILTVILTQAQLQAAGLADDRTARGPSERSFR